MSSDSNGASPSFYQDMNNCRITFGDDDDSNCGAGLCRILGPQGDQVDLTKVYVVYAPQVKTALVNEVNNYNSSKVFDGTSSFFRVVCNFQCDQPINPATDCSDGFVSHSKR